MGVLLELPRPFVVGVVVEPEEEQLAHQIASVAREGCHAAELNLSALPAGPSETTVALSGDVEDALDSSIAVYTTCRRRAFMAAYGMDVSSLADIGDEQRMSWQLQAVDAGAVALDIELDTFDPDPAPSPGSSAAAVDASAFGRPYELSRDPSAVSRQRDVIDAAHASGADVLASCHTGRRQTADGLVEIVAVAADRGADLVKIVAPCVDDQDLCSFVMASQRLVADGAPPFVLVGSGAWAPLTRMVGTHLGSSWVYVRPTEGRWTYPEQPTASQIASLISLIGWRVPEAMQDGGR